MRTGWIRAGWMSGALSLAWGAEASPWRAVAVDGGAGGADILLEDGTRHPARGRPIPAEWAGRELEIHGRLTQEAGARPPRAALYVERFAAADPPPAPVFAPLAPGRYARISRTLPEELLRPGGRIELDFPELGTSAASEGRDPIRMLFDLPSNYRRETRHPVIVHFGGGRGGAAGVLRWRSIVGPANFILLGADYDFGENTRRGLIRLGTCRDFDSRIALAGLQVLGQSTGIDTETILLTGLSSGAYSITDNLTNNPRPWQAFAGFCAIAGGARTGQPRLGHRPVLFLMGEGDTPGRQEALKEAVDSLSRTRGNRVTVRKFPGVGHAWTDAMTPAILEWLKSEIPALAALERRRERMAEPIVPAGGKDVVRAWIERSGLE